MTKPKFTPDPPPHLHGMPAEQAFPLFVDWVIRQEYRKEDWWPKNLEARVQALELLAPYCIGTWTIADAAYVNFGYEVVIAYELNCAATSTTYDTGETLGLYESTGLTIHGDRLVVSRRMPVSGQGVLGTWDIGSSTWTQRYTTSGTGGATITWHRSVSANGTLDVGDYVFCGVYTWDAVNGVRQNWYLNKVSDWSTASSTSLQGEQTLILDESKNYIGMVFPNGNATLRPKTSIGTSNSVIEPSGWTFQCGWWLDASSQWGLMYSENATGDLGWSFVADGYSGAAPTPSKTKLSQFTGQSWSVTQPHWRDGDRNIYFYGQSNAYKAAHDPTLPNANFIVKLDDQGDLVKIYDYYDTANVDAASIVGQNVGSSVSFSQEAGMFYHAASDSSYGTYQTTMIKHDVASDVWSKCTLNGLNSDTFYGRIASDNTAWHTYWENTPTTIKLLNSDIF